MGGNWSYSPCSVLFFLSMYRWDWRWEFFPRIIQSCTFWNLICYQLCKSKWKGMLTAYGQGNPSVQEIQFEIIKCLLRLASEMWYYPWVPDRFFSRNLAKLWKISRYRTHSLLCWNCLLTQVSTVNMYESESVAQLTQGLEPNSVPSSRKRLVD